MINNLEVRNLAIADALDLELSEGLNVFSGETGAGKSLIVDALELLLGARGSADLVRSGEDSLLVTSWWKDQSASRRVSTAGRSTARIDGEVVTVKELAEFTSPRVTVHGQHASQELLGIKKHHSFLDRALSAQVVEGFRSAYQAFTTAQNRLNALKQSELERNRQLDLLSYQLQEIDEVKFNVGEDLTLQEEVTLLSNMEQISSGASTAAEILSSSEQNALDVVRAAMKSLQGPAKYSDDAKNLLSELREALSNLTAIGQELVSLAENSVPDEERLHLLEERLGKLHRLQSKYGPGLQDVLHYREQISMELEGLESQNADLSSLEAEIETLKAVVQKRAEELSQARLGAAPTLSVRLEAVVQALGMPNARLMFEISPSELGANGLEDVVLLFSANMGEQLREIGAIASGGELSRVMLAISTVLGSDTPTVVFDEVDAGIGGETAMKVGEQLSRLARNKQVLVVTHLPQIAAFATQHFKVEKATSPEGRTVSRVTRLNDQARLFELARMLSGSTSSVAVQHAMELLDSARALPLDV
ncbi:DNA repair protein RecN [Deinococcus roseus]|uniref:DNA repair protein RecN n=1 Tax=Deinococcus roseus TaxID=392414 RepID=A0ABQ2CT36_9DEIO|nr:DNA repair protein RecN [Deinococcus roseus]GGJ18334.1 DNA repair protein RecN [Deinococcus roseus]